MLSYSKLVDTRFT